MNNKYFLVIPPGLEKIAADELTEKTALPYELVHGGLEIECDHQKATQLNRSLKIPSRILWRIASFKCRDFPKLFNKVQRIEWNKILVTTKMEVRSSSTNSRLFDSRKIEKSFMDGLKQYFMANTPAKKNIENSIVQKVYLRFENDNLSLSVDTSGEHLHQRAYRKSIGEAPLRENLAAACGQLLKKYLNDSSIIIDPMCGSGTLLSELALLNTTSSMREFVYPLSEISTEYSCMLELDGSDINDKVIKAAKDNAKRGGVKINYLVEDLFSEKKPAKQNEIIFSNLPYGIRIKTEKNLNELCKQIIRKYSPRVMAIIYPKEEKLKLQNFDNKESLSFQNGGIDVLFSIFVNSSTN